MCELCQLYNAVKDEPSPFTDDDFNRVSNGVWIGEITKYNLPVSSYFKTAHHLTNGIHKGYGKDIAEAIFGSPDYLMLTDLTENIYVFSAAKTYQEVRAMTNLLRDEKLKVNFYAFKAEAKKIFHDFNDAYLQAEYQTAIASSRMAAEWQRIEQEKDELPMLQYQTVGDDRVRPTHRQLDNIIKPVDDVFWNTYYPPNGWRCRCMTISLMDGKETDISEIKNIDEDVPPLFKMNSGKDRIVFKEKGKDRHPYFDVAKGDKSFAMVNFGLPLPQPGLL